MAPSFQEVQYNMTDRDKSYRLGVFSKDLVQDERFVELLDEIRNDIKEGILKTQLNESDKRESLYLIAEGVRSLESTLQNYINQYLKLENEQEENS